MESTAGRSGGNGAAAAAGGRQRRAPGGTRPSGPGGPRPLGPGGLRPLVRDSAGTWHSFDMRTASPVLVGRAEQLAVLDAALAPARREGPSVVLIGGEAGVGKSRLGSEFTARARGARAPVLTPASLEPAPPRLPLPPFTAVLPELVRE